MNDLSDVRHLLLAYKFSIFGYTSVTVSPRSYVHVKITDKTIGSETVSAYRINNDQLVYLQLSDLPYLTPVETKTVQGAHGTVILVIYDENQIRTDVADQLDFTTKQVLRDIAAQYKFLDRT